MIQAYLELMRPLNCLMAGVAALIGMLIASPEFAGTKALFVFSSVFLITGAGNGVNDYFDRDIDSINRPNRPIPSSRIEPRSAFTWSVALFVAGCTVASQINILCLGIASFNSLLLYLYARSLKGTPLAGNISVGYLTGSTFLFGGAMIGLDGAKKTLILFSLASLATVSREIEKDIEDMGGDRAKGARTLPLQIGETRAGIISALFLMVAILLSYLAPLGKVYLATVTLADFIFLISLHKILKGDAAFAERSLKWGMAIALLAFLATALIEFYHLPLNIP